MSVKVSACSTHSARNSTFEGVDAKAVALVYGNRCACVEITFLEELRSRAMAQSALSQVRVPHSRLRCRERQSVCLAQCSVETMEQEQGVSVVVSCLWGEQPGRTSP